MKRSAKSIGFFLIISLLATTACENQLGPGKRDTKEITHQYPGDSSSTTVVPSKETKTTKSTKSSSDTYTQIRGIWQRPDLVLEQLGELDGKVVADIGAGPYGYFSLHFALETKAKKVIAIDIDEEALAFIEGVGKKSLPENARDRIETRLVTPVDAKLKDQEADIVLIVNTTMYFKDRLQYFKNLRKGIKKGGKLVIIDYKKKATPMGPPTEFRIALGDLEKELASAGYRLLPSDDQLLEFQYIIKAVVD